MATASQLSALGMKRGRRSKLGRAVSSGTAALAATVMLLLTHAGCGGTESNSHEPNVGAECQADKDCENGAVCHESGVCVEPCSLDSQCAEGEACVEGRCEVQVPKTCDFPCPERMSCVEGQCRWDCTQTAECPVQYACRDSHCQLAACQKHSDCPEGTACLEGDCRPAECRENADCADEAVCSLGSCITVGLGECFRDEHCGENGVCVNGVCDGGDGPITPGGSGACEINLDCGSPRYYCVAKICRTSTECLTHAHCKAGQLCARNLCWDT
jgi:hypothetical protein